LHFFLLSLTLALSGKGSGFVVDILDFGSAGNGINENCALNGLFLWKDGFGTLGKDLEKTKRKRIIKKMNIPVKS
jgi:hypothetical protein